MSSLFLYDTEALSQLVPDNIYKQGLVYFRQDRVIDVYEQNRKLIAQVEGSKDDFPYDLELSVNKHNRLVAECDCHHSEICKHAVAALLSFTDELQQQDTHGSALENAIKDRVKKGQTEVKAKHVSGHPVFGNWQASSLISSTHWQQTYQIQIRSLTDRINYCSCPDHANNQLGTCKHIEAALHTISKKPALKSQQPQTPFIYIDAESNTESNTKINHSNIKLQRTANQGSHLSKLLDAYFNREGEFIGELPTDYFKLSDLLFGRDEISVGPDVKIWVEALVSNQAHQVKAQQIVNQIKLSGGQLPGVKATLYPYQVNGVAFLAANGRALLADDMGLGKTLQAIAATTWLMQHSAVKRTLIICPASLKFQWAREIEKFTGLKTQIIQGNAEKRQAQYRQDKPFFVINYELLLRDLTTINEQLAPDLMILDEAQRIKNWRTKIASAVKLIQTDYAFVLSGTPLENRLQDLYSLMQVVNPKTLGPLWRYMSDFHICDDKGKVLGYRNLTELRTRLEPVMLRRNRSIVSDQLPSRITNQLDLPMSNKQRELHDTALSNAGRLATIAKRRPLTPTEQNRMMAALQQTRMACNAAGLVDKETIGSPKLKELKNLIEEFCLNSGLKVVIFSQWKGMTDMVEALARSMNQGYVHLHGQVPTHKRGELMDRFQQDDATTLFISTDAGGTGLNLQAGSVVINMDIPWNPAVLEQRNARVHRLGQTKSVQIILMVSADSYEERVLALVNNKQLLFDNVISEGASEDVVGLSKQSVANVINEMVNDTGLKDELQQDASLLTPNSDPMTQTEAVSASDQAPVSGGDAKNETYVNDIVQQMQQTLGQQIQQVMAKEGGLLVIVDQLTDEAVAYIDQLPSPIPVAIIDQRTLNMLERLGSSSPIANAKPLPLESLHPWLNRARQQLGAAQILIEQDQTAGVMEVLCSATSALVSDKASHSQLIPPEEVTVWLYSQGLSQQLFTIEETALLSKIFSLRLSTDIPMALLQQMMIELNQLLGCLENY